MPSIVTPEGWQVKEVRVDYLTLTGAKEAEREHLIRMGQHLTTFAARSGYDTHPFAWMGYRGLSSGGCSWGIRDDGSLLRVSGDRASEVWRDCARCYGHCTRIDFAVTVYNPHETVWLASRTYTRACEHAGDHTANGVVSFVQDNQNGSTCYIGGRTSEKFARLYNKEAESKDAAYKGCWRWEVEYKGEAAGAILSALLRAGVSEQFIRSTVHRHFAERGAEPPWAAGGVGSALSIKREPTDGARRLDWFRLQVAPSVERAVRDSGILTVIRALGLERHKNPACGSCPSKGPWVTLSETHSPPVGTNGAGAPGA